MNKENKGLHVIITGVTGMAGEGVLHECLQHPAIAQILLVSHKPYGLKHPKIKEIIQQLF
jgi:FlaA1/EpsC-like NDP-sugar epimerase